MSRRSRFLVPAALVAAVATAGCFPLVNNQDAAQQDLIGGVDVSGDVCTAPHLLPIIIGGGLPDVANVRSAGTAGLAKTLGARGVGEDFFACPDEEELEDMLESGGEFGVFAGIPHQVLVAHRVPEGAEAPETFEASGTAKVAPIWQQVVRGAEPVNVPVDLTFRRAPEMDAQLVEFYESLTEGVEDAPEIVRDGEKIVGYVSSQLPGPLVGDLNVKAQYKLPGGTATTPYTGPFNALTMVGSRIALTEEQIGGVDRVARSRALRGAAPGDLEDLLGPDRPVVCLQNEDIITRGGGPEELLTLAFCPMPALFDSSQEEYEDLLAGVDAPTRDLRVLGSEGFAEQGGTATVPFTLRTAGAASSARLNLTAATGLAGATAVPAQGSIPFPATGDHVRGVNVQVPENAAPGTYDVTLTVGHGAATRTGTGRVVVLPKQAQGTSSQAGTGGQSQSRGRDNVYMGRDGSIAFGWVCPPACGNATADVTAPKAGISPKANTAQVSKPRLLRIARGKFKAQSGKRVRVKVKLFPKARRAVRRGRQVKALIVVRANGRGTPAVRRVTIKLRKAKG